MNPLLAAQLGLSAGQGLLGAYQAFTNKGPGFDALRQNLDRARQAEALQRQSLNQWQNVARTGFAPETQAAMEQAAREARTVQNANVMNSGLSRYGQQAGLQAGAGQYGAAMGDIAAKNQAQWLHNLQQRDSAIKAEGGALGDISNENTNLYNAEAGLAEAKRKAGEGMLGAALNNAGGYLSAQNEQNFWMDKEKSHQDFLKSLYGKGQGGAGTGATTANLNPFGAPQNMLNAQPYEAAQWVKDWGNNTGNTGLDNRGLALQQYMQNPIMYGGGTGNFPNYLNNPQLNNPQLNNMQNNPSYSQFDYTHPFNPYTAATSSANPYFNLNDWTGQNQVIIPPQKYEDGGEIHPHYNDTYPDYKDAKQGQYYNSGEKGYVRTTPDPYDAERSITQQRALNDAQEQSFNNQLLLRKMLGLENNGSQPETPSNNESSDWLGNLRKMSEVPLEHLSKLKDVPLSLLKDIPFDKIKDIPSGALEHLSKLKDGLLEGLNIPSDWNGKMGDMSGASSGDMSALGGIMELMKGNANDVAGDAKWASQNAKRIQSRLAWAKELGITNAYYNRNTKNIEIAREQEYVPGTKVKALYPIMDDNLSYGQAFANARSVVGRDGYFQWRGKTYGTKGSTDMPDLERNPEPKMAVPNEGSADYYSRLADYLSQQGLIKPKKLEHGGEVHPPTYEYNLLSNVLSQRNKHLNWVERGLNPEKYPKIINKDGSESTHRLSYSTGENGKAYVYPHIIQNEKGELQELSDNDAWNYALKTNTAMEVPNAKLALYYSQNGLIKHEQGGKVKSRVINIEGGEILVDAKGKPVKTFSAPMHPALGLNDAGDRNVPIGHFVVPKKDAEFYTTMWNKGKTKEAMQYLNSLD